VTGVQTCALPISFSGTVSGVTGVWCDLCPPQVLKSRLDTDGSARFVGDGFRNSADLALRAVIPHIRTRIMYVRKALTVAHGVLCHSWVTYAGGMLSGHLSRDQGPQFYPRG